MGYYTSSPYPQMPRILGQPWATVVSQIFSPQSLWQTSGHS